MKAFILPKQNIEEIDEKTRNFFQGHTNNINKFHTVNWEKITKPKFMGRLGIRKADHINKVHLLELLWRLFKSPNKILKKSYQTSMGTLGIQKKQINHIPSKFSKTTFPLYLLCTKLVIGDGNSTNLWFNAWLSKPVRQSILGPLLCNEDARTVSSIIYKTKHGACWKLQNIPFDLPRQILLQIASYLLSQSHHLPHDKNVEPNKIWFLYFQICLPFSTQQHHNPCSTH